MAVDLRKSVSIHFEDFESVLKLLMSCVRLVVLLKMTQEDPLIRVIFLLNLLLSDLAIGLEVSVEQVSEQW